MSDIEPLTNLPVS
jgi:hypothetical protein